MIPYPLPQRNLADQGSGPGQVDGHDDRPQEVAGGVPNTHSRHLKEEAGEELAGRPHETAEGATEAADTRSKAHAPSRDNAEAGSEPASAGLRVPWRSVGAAGISLELQPPWACSTPSSGRLSRAQRSWSC